MTTAPTDMTAAELERTPRVQSLIQKYQTQGWEYLEIVLDPSEAEGHAVETKICHKLRKRGSLLCMVMLGESDGPEILFEQPNVYRMKGVQSLVIEDTTDVV